MFKKCKTEPSNLTDNLAEPRKGDVDKSYRNKWQFEEVDCIGSAQR